MAVQCFPSLALLVACCPDTSVVSPEVHGCPEEFLAMRGCCQPEITSTVLKALGTLAPEEMAYALPSEGNLGGYRDGLLAIHSLMRTFLLDSDLLKLEAWRLYSLAYARLAIMSVDSIKDRYVDMQKVQDSQLLLREATACSRALGKALFRLENFHVFLLGHTAAARRTRMQDLHSSEIAEAFQPALELYELGMNSFDLLAYSIIPNLEAMSRDPTGAGFSLREGAKLNRSAGSQEVQLLVVSLGAWAKTGFLTIWSVLQHRSTPLRIFVLGDEDGLGHWRAAAEELQAQERRMLDSVSFVYIDFENHPAFREYLAQYPKGCSFGAAGKAILARVVCHLVLPEEVAQVISLDLGDLLVLEDISNLWQLFQTMEEHHLLAAPHAVALSHVNAGVVLYHVARMRRHGFAQETLRAVADMQRKNHDASCLRDQSIINILHSFREEFGYPEPSPVMILPCRWSVFPTTEWLSYWNSPEMWLPQLREKRRYPGIVSVNRVEVFCPDEMDLLSSWAFLPLSAVEETKQARLRVYALYEGHKTERYCSPERRAGERCCRCGEKAAVLHVAGDMKNWPSMQALLRAYMPPFKELPPNHFADALSKVWTGGDQRLQEILSQTNDEALVAAKALGIQAVFGSCATLRCKASPPEQLNYVSVQLRKVFVPCLLEVETTALRDTHLLLGIGAHSGVELVVNGRAEKGSCLRWVRSSPATSDSTAWTLRREIMCVPFGPKVEAAEGVEAWMRFSLKIGADGLVVVSFPEGEWGNFLPEEPLAIMLQNELTVSVGTFYGDTKWAVCMRPHGDAKEAAGLTQE
ncbi:unnamed protein product, partial [Effrenium voratum]